MTLALTASIDESDQRCQEEMEERSLPFKMPGNVSGISTPVMAGDYDRVSLQTTAEDLNARGRC